MYLPIIFFYPQFITYLHFVLYPSLFANESSFTPGYRIFQKYIYPPNTSSPNESPSTSGYHFTKCFIYPPKSIIETFTRINLITHDCGCSPMDHHLPTYTTRSPHKSSLPPDIISRKLLFTHQIQLSQRLPASFWLPMILDVHSWIII